MMHNAQLNLLKNETYKKLLVGFKSKISFDNNKRNHFWKISN